MTEKKKKKKERKFVLIRLGRGKEKGQGPMSRTCEKQQALSKEKS